MSAFTLEGKTLGKYRVLEALGRGGMAQVYRGYHPQLERYVAIKVLRADLVEQEEFLERFRREAHAVSGLRHPNIVQVYDFDAQDDDYYMVMELLEGDTLRARLNGYRVQKQRMPLAEIARILADVLGGLDYAHSEGLIHRDLKPANIMLTKKGQAVLTDFGIAQIMGSTQVTVSGALMGTLNYMAPEQGLTGQCDARSDVYSLGIVLYEMLTGYTPFDADTPLAILMKHLNDPLPLPSQLDPHLPPLFEGVVLKALAKSPEDRFQGAAEMAAALQSAAQGLPDGARPAIPPPGGIAPQVVFSGDSRRRIADRRFASEDTDREIRPLVPPGSAPSPAGSLPLSRVFDSPPSALGAIITSLGSFVLFNVFAAMLLSSTGLNLYRTGWAFEIFLAAAFFTLLAWAIQKPWLLTPAIILLGNAVILAWCALTGRWQDWAFLWMLEPLTIAAAILTPLALQKRPEGGPNLTRASSLYLTLLAMFLAIGACWFSFIFSLFR
ncbi:MAG: protein kinase domain-containing protein [Chloroflexota bacterium]